MLASIFFLSTRTHSRSCQLSMKRFRPMRRTNMVAGIHSIPGIQIIRNTRKSKGLSRIIPISTKIRLQNCQRNKNYQRDETLKHILPPNIMRLRLKTIPMARNKTILHYISNSSKIWGIWDRNPEILSQRVDHAVHVVLHRTRCKYQGLLFSTI